MFNFFKKEKGIKGLKITLEMDFFCNSDCKKGQQLVLNENIPIDSIVFNDNYLLNAIISFIWLGSADELKKILYEFSNLGRIRQLTTKPVRYKNDSI